MNYRNIGKKIKVYRVENDLNQKEFSQIAGINTATLAAIETGKGSPSTRTLGKIAAVLQVSVSELVAEREGK